MSSPIDPGGGRAAAACADALAERDDHAEPSPERGRPAVRNRRRLKADAIECAWLPSTSPIVSPRLGDFAAIQLILRANAQNGTCYRLAPPGELRVAVAEVLSGLEAIGYRLLRVSDASSSGPSVDAYEYNREAAFALVHPSSYAEIDSVSENPVRFLSIDEDHVALLRERLPEWVRPAIDKNAGPIYMLKSDCDGVHFSPVGTGGRPLRRENYAAATLEGIDHVTRDIAAREPCGRISLLTGPAGTGKTHIIRSILARAAEARFVVLQPRDLESFLDASPLSALSDFARGEANGHPIVLIIEDADGCLVPRGADNISQISALLNLSDGLIGATFDIRVLATTNAKTVEVDSAILRPGRLCRRIDVPPLQAAHATEVLGGLLGAAPASPFRKPITLAEVYAAAREPEAR